jgi:hypothetical protein
MSIETTKVKGGDTMDELERRHREAVAQADPEKEQRTLYVGTKLILVEPMDEDRFKLMKGLPTSLDTENRPGYRVTYPDGYVSWSPKETFENAYRPVTTLEKALFNK